MARRANGQEFGQALHNRKNNNLRQQQDEPLNFCGWRLYHRRVCDPRVGVKLLDAAGNQGVEGS